MKIFASGLFLLIVLAGCKVSYSPESQKDLPEPTVGTASQQAEAAEAAREYLALIDRKEYEKTWDRAGPALRDATSKFMWTNTLKVLGQTLSIPGKREIEGFAFSTQIDANAPVGDYVLVQFKSESGNVTATEKVVMQKEQGIWKIVGYFRTKQYGANT